MALRIDWGRAIQPIRNVQAVLAAHKPALIPHVESHQLQPALAIADTSAGQASGGERKSRWNLAKTMVVQIPEDQTLKKLIDVTSEFVAQEGWDFEKMLIDQTKDNPRYRFMSSEKENLEDPLHVYYRWRVFAFAQGDNIVFWRTEQFQIYENGPLWQAPHSQKRETPDLEPQGVQRLDLKLLGTAGELLKKKLSGGGAAAGLGGGGGIGGADLTIEELRTVDELIADVSSARASIMKAMVFCLDKSQASQVIAGRICRSITEAQPGMTTAQLTARLMLLSDVLHNSHFPKPGASQYRRQFQEFLPDIFERLREVCDGISTIAAGALREKILKLLDAWTEWSSFPPRFTKGLRSTLCGKNTVAAGENQAGEANPAILQAQEQWQSTTDSTALDRACRQRGLCTKGSRLKLVDRLCMYEACWPAQALAEVTESEFPIDPELDGEAVTLAELKAYEEEVEQQEREARVKLRRKTRVSILGVKLFDEPSFTSGGSSSSSAAPKKDDSKTEGKRPSSRSRSSSIGKQRKKAADAAAAAAAAPIEAKKIEKKTEKEKEKSEKEGKTKGKEKQTEKLGKIKESQKESKEPKAAKDGKVKEAKEKDSKDKESGKEKKEKEKEKDPEKDKEKEKEKDKEKNKERQRSRSRSRGNKQKDRQSSSGSSNRSSSRSRRKRDKKRARSRSRSRDKKKR
eukprot:TRINITY_DN10891_c0_g4_i1.p1 TRINITY_DN10891_c0_g4~~TRINITY_DN10891_c0_g4_i1.p1  ORF type:complete len:758 (-),score=161.10 TRINITY_DN10891_c0_g4_i1:139-2196(-)